MFDETLVNSKLIHDFLLTIQNHVLIIYGDFLPKKLIFFTRKIDLKLVTVIRGDRFQVLVKLV